MALSASDWVTILATAASSLCSALVAFGIAIWQIKKTTRSPTMTGELLFEPSVRRWLVAQLVPFAFSSMVAVVIIVQAILSDGPVTRTFVVSLVSGGFLLAFSILSSLGFVVAAAFRPAYLRIQNLKPPSAGQSSATTRIER